VVLLLLFQASTVATKREGGERKKEKRKKDKEEEGLETEDWDLVVVYFALTFVVFCGPFLPPRVYMSLDF
jgi:hypothetical protein